MKNFIVASVLGRSSNNKCRTTVSVTGTGPQQSSVVEESKMSALKVCPPLNVKLSELRKYGENNSNGGRDVPRPAKDRPRGKSCDRNKPKLRTYLPQHSIDDGGFQQWQQLRRRSAYESGPVAVYTKSVSITERINHVLHDNESPDHDRSTDRVCQSIGNYYAVPESYGSIAFSPSEDEPRSLDAHLLEDSSQTNFRRITRRISTYGTLPRSRIFNYRKGNEINFITLTQAWSFMDVFSTEITFILSYLNWALIIV